MTVYSVLKKYCGFALRLYFKTLQINNVKSIPTSGPVIFIPNHQNAFLDAVIVICTTPRNPWSIARASVFKKGFVTTMLTAIQIKPVFRIRDGFGSLRNNDALIQEWSDMLYAGHDIIIFAEGNHNEPYAAGDLQRGFARMALQFEEKYSVPLTIVPVGCHYDDHYSFRSRVLVNFGDPIQVDDIVKSTLTEREKLETLVAVTDKALKNLAIAIPSDEQYKSKFDFLIKYRTVQKDMSAQLESDKRLLQSFPEPPNPTGKRKPVPTFWKAINPLVWIGVFSNFLPYWFIARFIKKKIKDPQWISSLKFAFGISLVPIYYLVVLIIFYVVYPNIWATVAVAILLPATGILATDLLKK